jgi:type 1 glutamine amidotransferase
MMPWQYLASLAGPVMLKHPMNETDTIPRRLALKLFGAAVLVTTTPHCGYAERKRKILLFTKSSSFEHDVVKQKDNGPSLCETTLIDLGRILGFDIIATKDGRVFEGDLAQYDAFFFFTAGNPTEPGIDKTPPMSARGKEAPLAAVRDGKAFVGIHSASDTFHSLGSRFETQERPDPYVAMLGGEFISHGSQQEARAKVVDPTFPGLEGLSAGFSVKDEWYSLKNFSKDIHVLLVLETEGMHDSDYQRPPFPIAWARKENNGRVYFNALGHRDDVWMSERFRQILAGAIAWALGAEDAALTANLSEVAPQASVMPPDR